jgi:dipeptidyl aminopeptidase/acylaminoacyl peptidase
VFVHGYIPPTLYKTTVNYQSYIDFLARRGLVVFKIDLRGHDQSEGEAGGAYYSPDYVVDVLNARAALANLPSVNPEKIGLWGHSMAGNVVFRSMAVGRNIDRAVIWAGAVYTYEDLAQFRINDNSYRPPGEGSERRRKRDELFAMYGPFDPTSWFWKQVPGTNYLDGVRGNLQIHHAVDDGVVDIGYSRNLMNVLEGTGINAELFEYQNGGHNLTGASFTTAMGRSAEFLVE